MSVFGRTRYLALVRPSHSTTKVRGYTLQFTLLSLSLQSPDHREVLIYDRPLPSNLLFLSRRETLNGILAFGVVLSIFWDLVLPLLAFLSDMYLPCR